MQNKPNIKPAEMTEKVQEINKAQVDALTIEAQERERAARAREAKHTVAVLEAEKHWKKVAQAKDWDTVRANLDVYRFCGQQLKEDPRRSKEYKEKVLKELGLDTIEDMELTDLEIYGFA